MRLLVSQLPITFEHLEMCANDFSSLMANVVLFVYLIKAECLHFNQIVLASFQIHYVGVHRQNCMSTSAIQVPLSNKGCESLHLMFPEELSSS